MLLSSINVFLLPLCLPEFRHAIKALLLCQHPAHNHAKVKVGVQISMTSASRADLYDDLSHTQAEVQQEMMNLHGEQGKLEDSVLEDKD